MSMTMSYDYKQGDEIVSVSRSPYTGEKTVVFGAFDHQDGASVWMVTAEGKKAAHISTTYTREEYEKKCTAVKPAVVMVKCDCGHECAAGAVMSSTRGSCCQACYDRMSE